MNLFKRTTASVALVALVSGVFSTGVSAYDASELMAANAIAAKGYINSQETAAGYNLEATITRGEMAKVAANVAGIDANTTCMNKFADVSATTPNTWACGYVEALLANGLVSANADYNPNANISKSEVVKLMLTAAGETVSYTDATWQADFVAHAVANGFVASFSDYNTSAKRGFVFSVAAAATTEGATEGDAIDEILKAIAGEDDTTEPTDTTDTTPVMNGDDVLEVTLSADTAESATVPGNISGLPVASFDFTAGSEDVTLSSLVVKRRGLSDSDTLTALAAFTEEGRASKSKNDSLENDTEAQLTLSNGGVVVKAGETTTITIVADINTTGNANGDEFSIELTEVVASSTVDGLSNLEANTMKVGGVDAATIDINEGSSLSDVKAGDTDAEVAKFEIEGDNDSDVVLHSITLKQEGTIDEEDEMANFSLVHEGDVLATVASSNGKYVTFTLSEGFNIEEDKTEDFEVTADIIGGAGKTINFEIDKTLDVTAEGVKYGFGAAVTLTDSDFQTVNVDAGELSLSDMDAPSDKIRQDKKNVELGSIKVTNVAGQNLELQKLGVDVVSVGANVNAMLENFEAVIDGTSYELDIDTASAASNATFFEDTDLDIVLAQGVTTIVFRADTKETLNAGDTLTLSISNLATSGDGGVFYVEETEDDVAVSDITPSSLTFKDLEVIASAATAASVPLANVTVVRGAEAVVAAQFEVEAEEASSIELDDIVVTVAADGGAFNTTTRLPQNYVSKLALYKGSVSDANLLDEVTGSKVATSGQVTFDGFKVLIDADQKETFIVTVNIVDGADPVGEAITVATTTMSAEDDDNDDITVVNQALASNKTITVTNFGTLSATADNNNEDNEDVKTILAGENVAVFSVDVESTNESMDVEDVVFTTATDLTTSVTSASLYLDDTLIATNSNSDITATTVTFDNLTNLIIAEESQELRLVLNTANIGYQKVGAAIAGATFTNVALNNVEGVDSGKTAANETEAITSKAFSIVPATITPSVVASLDNSSIAQIKVTSEAGDNSITTSNTAPNSDIDLIKFSTLGSTDADVSLVYTLVNVDNEAITVVGGLVGTVLTFDLTDGAFDVAGLNSVSDNSSETFKVVITGATVDADVATLTLLENGITYDVDTTTGITTNLTSQIDFGTRSY
jgi:hypothetical protein